MKMPRLFGGDSAGLACLRGAILAFLVSGCGSPGTPTEPGDARGQQPTIDLASGWTPASWTYNVQKPFDLTVRERFEYGNGIWHTWVHASDRPLYEGSPTGARTEMRWLPDYTTGQHMFDGDVFIPSGTSGVCVQQVFGGATAATASMIIIRNGRASHYNDVVIRANAWDSWWNLKVHHDAVNNIVKIYDDDVLKYTGADHGDATHYFKNGVYSNSSPSSRMDSSWRSLRHWIR